MVMKFAKVNEIKCQQVALFPSFALAYSMKVIIYTSPKAMAANDEYLMDFMKSVEAKNVI